jgi:hypothetical protein
MIILLISINTIIDIVVSLTILHMIGRIITGTPFRIHELLYSTFFGSGTAALVFGFIVNMAVSALIMKFVGQGLYAGMANLLASVIVGLFTKKFMSRYDPERRDGYHEWKLKREARKRKQKHGK